MPQPPFEVSWLDTPETVSIAELSVACGLNTDELTELVDYGALAPLPTNTQGFIFSAICVVPLRKVCKLRTDFDLDVFTVAILMGYLDRIDELERQIHSMEAVVGAPK